jgi:hypothetical protein
MTMSLTLLTWLPAWLLDIVKTRLYVFKRPVHNNNHGDWVTKSSEESYTHKIVESAVLSVLQPGEEYEWRHLPSSNVFLLLTLFHSQVHYQKVWLESACLLFSSWKL